MEPAFFVQPIHRVVRKDHTILLHGRTLRLEADVAPGTRVAVFARPDGRHSVRTDLGGDDIPFSEQLSLLGGSR
jgi:hypothetical protein